MCATASTVVDRQSSDDEAEVDLTHEDFWVKGTDLNSHLAKLRGVEQPAQETGEPRKTSTAHPADARCDADDESDDDDDSQMTADSHRVPCTDGNRNDEAETDIDNSLAPPEEAKVAQHKEAGNVHFRAGRFREAREAYAKAADVYDGRTGSDAAQRAERVAVCSNLAEALLRLGEWAHALTWADRALAVDSTNAKARVRRARALAEIGGLTELDAALAELRRVAQDAGGRVGASERALTERLLASRKALRAAAAADAHELRRAFANGGGLGGAATNAVAPSESPPPAAAPAAGALYATEESIIGLEAGTAATDVWEESRAALLAQQSTPPAPGAALAHSELMAAFERLGANGSAVALPALAKAEWLCDGLQNDPTRFRRFRANASMRTALLEVSGGSELVRALGYRNVGATAEGATSDDWWEACGEAAERGARYEAAKALFARVKQLLRPDTHDDARPPSGSGGDANGVPHSGDSPHTAVPPAMPPVDASNGGAAEWGTWSQTRDEVVARVALPHGTRASDLRVEIGSATLRVAMRPRAAQQQQQQQQQPEALRLLGGELSCSVVADECAWQLAEDGTLELSLLKATAAQAAGRLDTAGWWPRVLRSDCEYDVRFCDAAKTYVRVDPRGVAGLRATPP